MSLQFNSYGLGQVAYLQALIQQINAIQHRICAEIIKYKN